MSSITACKADTDPLCTYGTGQPVMHTGALVSHSHPITVPQPHGPEKGRQDQGKGSRQRAGSLQLTCAAQPWPLQPLIRSSSLPPSHALDLYLHQSKGSLWCYLRWLLETPRGRIGSFTLSALDLWGLKALQGGGLMAKFVWTDPNIGLTVGECGLFIGSLCRCEMSIKC